MQGAFLFYYFCAMAQASTIEIDNLPAFKLHVLNWIQQFDVACIYDSNILNNPLHAYSHHSYDYIIAVGVHSQISSNINSTLTDIDNVINEKPGWYFGLLSYELKNCIENLDSKNADELYWPEFYFFTPQVLILVNKNQAEIQTNDGYSTTPESVFNEIMSVSEFNSRFYFTGKMQARITKDKYLENITEIKKHILRGDIYEVNFCQEFFSYSEFNPYSAYLELSKISPSPFGCFFKLNNKYLLSASPERYLKKTGNMLISQPIKGTAARVKDIEKDTRQKVNLSCNDKERAENIMIVDLVRNDLSKIAENNSVKVDELCGVYTFKQVHQLISTISCTLKTQSFEKIIKATFPMGSMTGAPKISAMQIAEKYEAAKRGLYSGSVGYITPDNNFDFNVVIRSLQYNSENKYLSYMVGGAITAYSDAEKEYEECLLKASAIEVLLNHVHHA